jgi:hypothetical protein
MAQKHDHAAAVGLPEQLPTFLQQAVGAMRAAQLPLLGLAMGAAVRVASNTLQLLLHRNCTADEDVSWAWAASMLQQMVLYVQAAGLMDAQSASASASSCSGHTGSSSSSSRVGGKSAHSCCTDVIAAGLGMVRRGSFLVHEKGKSQQLASCRQLGSLRREFTASPIAVKFLLHLLASRCLLLHQHLQQQQQHGTTMRRLGRHSAVHLLPLLDPRQKLAQLLPGDAFLAADAAKVGTGPYGSSNCPDDMLYLVSMVRLGLDMRGGWPHAASTAELQLTVQLVALTAVHWQQIYHSLSQQQQQALLHGVEVDQQDTNPAAASAGASQTPGQQLKAAQTVLHSCCFYLADVLRYLWLNEQWLPQLQLVQQQEGAVLLQALTLALHCPSLDGRFAQAPLEKTTIPAQSLLKLFALGMWAGCTSGVQLYVHSVPASI